MNEWFWFVGSLLENQEGTVHSLYMIKQMNGWLNEWMNERMNEWFGLRIIVFNS
mgnify:CR=1 FL=1